MGIDVDGDTTDDCSTKAGANSKCSLAHGGTFTLRAYLNSLGPATSYQGYQVVLEYAGPEWKGEESTDTDPWPDCAIRLAGGGSGLVGFGCLIDLEAPRSTYTGLLATTDFNCTGSGSIIMVHGLRDTALWHSSKAQYVEGEGETETLTINCSATAALAHPIPR